MKDGVGDRVRVDEKWDVCLMYDVLKPIGNTYTCIEFCIILAMWLSYVNSLR